MAVVELEEVVEDRVGKLESDVQHLQADVTEIKADARQFRSEVLARFEKVYERFEKADDRFGRIEKAIEELRTQMIRGDLQTRIWMLVSNGTVLAVMAHGFKWI